VAVGIEPTNKGFAELILWANCCFQFALSASGYFHIHLVENLAVSKSMDFRCASGKQMLPFAAN
jgi:hypothetical protein